jgi:hypothetical protein
MAWVLSNTSVMRGDPIKRDKQGKMSGAHVMRLLNTL